MKDKSETHFKVRKNGHEGWLSKEVVAHVGRAKCEAQGWDFVPETPPEVQEIRSKKAEVKQAEIASGLVSVSELSEVKEQVKPKVKVVKKK